MRAGGVEPLLTLHKILGFIPVTTKVKMIRSLVWEPLKGFGHQFAFKGNGHMEFCALKTGGQLARGKPMWLFSYLGCLVV